MLKRIHIDNYKCLSNFDLTFGDLTLLIGANGCGKSAVFEVAGKLRDFIRGDSRVGELFSAGDLTKWSKKREQSFELEFDLKDATFLYRLVVEHNLERRLARVKREELTCNDLPLFEFANGEVQLYRDNHSEGPKYSFDWTQSGIAPVAEGLDNKRLCAFRDRIRRFVTLFLETRRIEHGTESDTDRLADNGENFASWYQGRLQENPRRAFEAMDHLRNVLPGFADLKLVEKGDYRELQVEFAPLEGNAGNNYRFDQLSDGQRALIVHHLLLYADDADRTLFLDEPENYITLPELQPLLAELEDGCGDDLPQTILISHHPEAMDFLVEKAIWLGREPESHTRVLDVKNDTMLKVSELYAQGLVP
ncbi:MAG: AAA family ATPase [Gemmatimonadetes bacterium]|nr:AAA family ATPase [Gemmatimonadota bacterium]